MTPSLSTYRISPDVLVAHLEGEAVLLDLTTKKYFRLNATGAAVWKGLEAGEDRSRLVDRLVAGFEVGPEEAGRETDRLLAELLDRSLIAPAEGDDGAAVDPA